MHARNSKLTYISGLLLLVFLTAAPVHLLGQEDTNYAGSFLDLGIGSRAIALGSAYVSVANDGTSFYWNPAGASTLVRPEVSGMYASLYKSLGTHYHLGFTRPLYGAGSVSINWVRLGVSDVPRYDSSLLDETSYDTRVDESTRGGDWEQYALTAPALGFSNSYDDALYITLSKLNKLDIDFGWQYFVIPVTIPVGINIKLIRQSLFEENGSGIGFDFGTMLKFGIDDLLDDSRLGKVSLGFAAKDVWNTKITWNTDSRHTDRIQRSWHAGASYLQPLPRISGQLLLAYAFQYKYESTHQYGLEYLYFNRLAIRFGLTDKRFTAGVGIRLSLFQIDYAFRSHDLAGSHLINTSIRL